MDRFSRELDRHITGNWGEDQFKHQVHRRTLGTPVLQSWHEENCANPVLHGHPREIHVVCSTCGNTVKAPVKGGAGSETTNKGGKKI